MELVEEPGLWLCVLEGSIRPDVVDFNVVFCVPEDVEDEVAKGSGIPVKVVGKVILEGSPGWVFWVGWLCGFGVFEPNWRGRRSAMMGLKRYKWHHAPIPEIQQFGVLRVPVLES
jgi:hypothetical protein